MCSSPSEGRIEIAPRPGDEGVKEVFAVGEVVSVPAPLQVFMDRHEGWEPESRGGHPLDKDMGWDGGSPLAWTTVDSMQNSSDNRRSRTTASSGARIRWRARTRAWRERIRQSPLLLIGVSKISIRRTFADISGHSAPVSDSVSDSGMTGWRYGREWFPGLGRSKCQPGVRLTAESAEGAELFWVSCPSRKLYGLRALSAVNSYPPSFPLRRERRGRGIVLPSLLPLAAGRRTFRTHQPQFEMR